MNQFDLVLFDMDGLLLDTEAVYTQVTQSIIGRFGHTFDWSLKQQMMGRKEEDAAAILIESLGISMTAQEYLIERNQGHKAKFPFCKPLAGVIDLVKYLHDHNVPIAVATSSHRDAFILKSMNNQDLFKYFRNITCGDDYEDLKSKPFPDIFIKAAMGINKNYDAARCLVFEDSPIGVKAGLNAGMKVVWIPDPNIDIDPSLADQCFQVLKSMKDFDPTLVKFSTFNGV